EVVMSLFIIMSAPKTINSSKNENNITFIIKVKFPFFNSCSFFAYLEKSPKFKITIEKYANIVPVTAIKGGKFSFVNKF
mgnify:CR=1